MQLRVRHETVYRYDDAATMIVQALRLWPAANPAQRVGPWQVRVDGRPIAPSTEDGFGNPVATHAIDRDVHCARVLVEGLVETEDRSGVHGAPVEWLPPAFYLARTALTAASEAIIAFAGPACGEGGDLERLHRLMLAVRERVDYLPKLTDAETPAADAFAAGAGVCQDHAHVLIAAARSLGFPARYVSGYLCPLDDSPAASHAWAEVFVSGLGWAGFDAANRQSPNARYVRIACGRDYRDAAPLRGVRLGGRVETMHVEVAVSAGAGSAQ